MLSLNAIQIPFVKQIGPRLGLQASNKRVFKNSNVLRNFSPQVVLLNESVHSIRRPFNVARDHSKLYEAIQFSLTIPSYNRQNLAF